MSLPSSRRQSFSKAVESSGDFVGRLVVIGAKDGKEKAQKLSDHFFVQGYPSIVTRRLPINQIDIRKLRQVNELLNTFLGDRVKHTSVAECETETCNFITNAEEKVDKFVQNAATEVVLSKENKQWKSDSAVDHWSWPLGDVIIKSTESELEATFSYHPFESDEIMALISCIDLTIRCDPMEDRPMRHVAIMRTYHLPNNVDPSSVRFFLLESDKMLRITAEKIPPLKFHPAVYLDDIDFHLIRSGIPVELVLQLKHAREGKGMDEKILAALKEGLNDEIIVEAVKSGANKKGLVRG